MNLKIILFCLFNLFIYTSERLGIYLKMTRSHSKTRIKKVETNSTRIQKMFGLHWKFDSAAYKKIEIINFKLIILFFIAMFLWMLYNLNIISEDFVEIITMTIMLLQAIIVFISSFFRVRIVKHIFPEKKKKK